MLSSALGVPPARAEFAFPVRWALLQVALARGDGVLPMDKRITLLIHERARLPQRMSWRPLFFIDQRW